MTGEDKPLGIEEVVETLELRVAAREAELEAYNERILTLKAENDALRRVLKQLGHEVFDEIARASTPPPLGV